MGKSDKCTDDLQVGNNNFQKARISFETEVLQQLDDRAQEHFQESWNQFQDFCSEQLETFL